MLDTVVTSAGAGRTLLRRRTDTLDHQTTKYIYTQIQLSVTRHLQKKNAALYGPYICSGVLKEFKYWSLYKRLLHNAPLYIKEANHDNSSI